ncbi:hypothetical protein [Nocardia brasiliensis]|uniref:hypothetical protein n=1 Tax=Nocardia brasiliensis TaxID=37326 RepID=UPI0015812543|nr:hypothetical protein [Nocardia brasiliensis]
MGKHSAPRKSEVTMQFAVVSTAAVLTALVCTHRDGPLSGRPASNEDHTASGLATRQFLPPPARGPDIVPELPTYDPPPVDIAPTASPAPWTPPAAPPPAEPEPPAPRDILGGMTAAWISGTQQGYDCLTKIEQTIAAHVRAVMDQHAV